MEKPPKRHVAVVGTGLAGLVTAYLLHHDLEEKFDVEMFERVCQRDRTETHWLTTQGSALSLAASSVTVADKTWGQSITVDVPMRAFAGGYYQNMIAMLEYLGVCHRAQRFRYIFSRSIETRDVELGPCEQTYFICASDNDEFPPPRPTTRPVVRHWLEVMYVAIGCYWFTLCCSWLPASAPDETFERWLARIRIPHRFASEYVLPLFSSIATCSHRQLLDFPASDVLEYRNAIRHQNQHVVTGGIQKVQDTLAADLHINTAAKICQVRASERCVQVDLEIRMPNEELQMQSRRFDLVVLAVSPDVAAKIFQPARKQLEQIPVRLVQTVVSREDSGRSDVDSLDEIRLNSYDDPSDAATTTEATHVHQGICVTSCGRGETPRSNVMSRPQFTRALRTPASREVIQQLFQRKPQRTDPPESEPAWRSGNEGVYMVGAWCWDGLPLLEGAVVSAMRVAHELRTDVPWEGSGQT